MSKARKFKEKPVKYEDKPTNLVEDFPVKLAMWYFDQCDPKRCSGMILKKHGYLSTLNKQAKFSGVVLTPTAKKIISPEDHDLVGQFGLCVIDCSWVHFDEVKVKSVKANERLLPYCLASNPVNYGKEIKLNCAEALAGALLFSGWQEEAERIMDVFKWGPAFFSVNELYFDRYIQCLTSADMELAQTEMIATVKQLKLDNRNREIDFPPNSSDEEEDDEEQEVMQKQSDRRGMMPEDTSSEEE